MKTCPGCHKELASVSYQRHELRADCTVVSWQCPHCGLAHSVTLDPSQASDQCPVEALLADAQTRLAEGASLVVAQAALAVSEEAPAVSEEAPAVSEEAPAVSEKPAGRRGRYVNTAKTGE